LAFAVCAPLLSAGALCPSNRQTIPVNRKEARRLQSFVNEGHEPWRLDAQAVAAEKIFELEKTPQQNWNLYSLALTQIESNERLAVFEYQSRQQEGTSYRVTVRRLEWLLPLAKKWEFILWVPTEIVVIKCDK